jgi:acyl carrier protein
MFRLLQTLVVWLGKFVLSLRYWVTVKGKEEALTKPGPYLILPNHPGYCDPPNILVSLWPIFKMRPILLETNFQSPVLAPFAWLSEAIKVPDVSQTSAESRQRAYASVEEAVKALESGRNVILWPSGHLTRDGRETIGGTRSVTDILAKVPNVTLVLVRTRGLWGSSLSWAYAHKPSLMGGLFKGVLWLLVNLIFFAPRRRVTMTVEAFPKGTHPEGSREAVNGWLEEWFNKDTNGAAETPTYRPYHFLFGAQDVEYPPPIKVAELDVSKIKPATKAGVAEILSEKLKRPLTEQENQPQITFLNLGIDSLDSMDMTMEVEHRFGFRSETMPTTVGQLWALAEGKLETGPSKPVPQEWFTPPSGSLTVEINGDTVLEAVLRRIQKTPKDVAVCDDMSGVLTYEKFLIGSMLMGERFRNLPGENVGLLLPASVAALVSLMGLHIGGKLPVILNWTTGPNNLEHAVKLLNIKYVITSKRFIDRAHVVVPGAEFVYLEEVRTTIGRFEKLWNALRVKLFLNSTIESILKQAKPEPHKPAVVLFTSGSDKSPKAVPLTNQNIIADLNGAIPILQLDRQQVILVFLPLFHSFGHTVTGLLPLFTGLKCVYHPDPTDAGGLVRKTANYKPTALAATPTFFGYMLDRAKPGELESLEIVVVGAEKCPEPIFNKTKQLAPKAVIAEGYGITECSPVVSVNPPKKTKPGTIGKPLIGP